MKGSVISQRLEKVNFCLVPRVGREGERWWEHGEAAPCVPVRAHSQSLQRHQASGLSKRRVWPLAAPQRPGTLCHCSTSAWGLSSTQWEQTTGSPEGALPTQRPHAGSDSGRGLTRELTLALVSTVLWHCDLPHKLLTPEVGVLFPTPSNFLTPAGCPTS